MTNPETEKVIINPTEKLRERIHEIICGRELPHHWVCRRKIDQILKACKEEGLKFVDTDSLRIIPAQTASQSDSYWADGIGFTWERDAPLFGQFYKAGFRKFEEIEL